MAKTKTSSAVKQRYNEKAYDRLSITVPKGCKELLDVYCKYSNCSINGLVNNLLRNKFGYTDAEWKAGRPLYPDDIAVFERWREYAIERGRLHPATQTETQD